MTAKDRSPRDLIEALEQPGSVAGQGRERFEGYGVIGLTFRSGHVLGLRRFPRSSIGPGYTSVWHRSPDGRWSFWSTEAPALSCARYTGSISCDTRQTTIRLAWPGTGRLLVEMAAPRLSWELDFQATRISALLGAVARGLPPKVLAHRWVLGAMGPIAGALLGVGRLALTGAMPNGQRFNLVPSHVWTIPASRAELEGEALGELAPLPEQARIGDFRIPQRGLLAIGELDFDLLDPARHSTRTVRAEELGNGAVPRRPSGTAPLDD